MRLLGLIRDLDERDAPRPTMLTSGSERILPRGKGCVHICTMCGSCPGHHNFIHVSFNIWDGNEDRGTHQALPRDEKNAGTRMLPREGGLQGVFSLFSIIPRLFRKR